MESSSWVILFTQRKKLEADESYVELTLDSKMPAGLEILGADPLLKSFRSSGSNKYSIETVILETLLLSLLASLHRAGWRLVACTSFSDPTNGDTLKSFYFTSQPLSPAPTSDTPKSMDRKSVQTRLAALSSRPQSTAVKPTEALTQQDTATDRSAKMLQLLNKFKTANDKVVTAAADSGSLSTQAQTAAQAKRVSAKLPTLVSSSSTTKDNWKNGDRDDTYPEEGRMTFEDLYDEPKDKSFTMKNGSGGRKDSARSSTSPPTGAAVSRSNNSSDNTTTTTMIVDGEEMEFELVQDGHPDRPQDVNAPGYVPLLYLDPAASEQQVANLLGRHGGSRIDYGSDDEIDSDDEVLEEEPAWERASLDPASAHLAASNKATGSKGESVLRPAVAGKAAGKLFSAMAGGVSKLGKSVSVFSGSTSKGTSNRVSAKSSGSNRYSAAYEDRAADPSNRVPLSSSASVDSRLYGTNSNLSGKPQPSTARSEVSALNKSGKSTTRPTSTTTNTFRRLMSRS